MKKQLIAPCLVILMAPGLAYAGPPFITDDPAPVDLHHFETFYFTAGASGRDGFGGASGVDFNYGLARDLHINIAVPFEYDHPKSGAYSSGIGNIELAAKYRFLHQESFGWDVAVYPRVILKSASDQVGDDHAAFFLPVWIGRSGEGWSTYGGGGCLYNQGDEGRNYCQAGWVVTRDLASDLHVGVEVVHETADAKGGRASTALGAGVTYDLNDHYHLLAYAGPNLQNTGETARYNSYAALQTTF
jgi:hypothetical protein